MFILVFVQGFRVTSHLRGCPSEKNRTRATFNKTPKKLYTIRKLNKCTLRKKYIFSDVFFQEVSGAGNIKNQNRSID